MKKLVTTALALAAAGTATKAGPGDDEWLELDREINSLASSLKPAQDGMGWAALIRTFYAYSTDNILNPGGLGDDVSGLQFKDIDFANWGSVGDYGWRINVDVDDGSPDITSSGDTDIILEDGHLWWHCGDYFVITMGHQKPHLLRSAYIDPEKTLFADRSGLGSTLDVWDSGVQANGTYDAFAWWFGVFNGFDDEQVDHIYAVRAEWNLGAGAGMGEGALGGNDDLNGTIGLSYKVDDTQDTSPVSFSDDSDAWFLDIVGSVGPLGFGFEYADLDDDEFLVVHSEDYMAELLEAQGVLGSATTFVPDSSPWNIWASWLINPEWEVGLRYEDMDNDDYSHPAIGGTGSSGPDNQLLSAVVAYYQAGHNAKWQAQWTDIDADSGFDDGSILQVGLTVGMTR